MDEELELDWPAIWAAMGPEPAELQDAAAALVAAARAGWRPTADEAQQARRVLIALRWDEEHPRGHPAKEVRAAFADALAAAPSPPLARLLTAAATWEPQPPRPGSWSESLYAALTGEVAW